MQNSKLSNTCTYTCTCTPWLALIRMQECTIRTILGFKLIPPPLTNSPSAPSPPNPLPSKFKSIPHGGPPSNLTSRFEDPKVQQLPRQEEPPTSGHLHANRQHDGRTLSQTGLHPDEGGVVNGLSAKEIRSGDGFCLIGPNLLQGSEK